MFKRTKLQSPPAKVVFLFLEIFLCICLFIGVGFCIFPELTDGNTYTVEVTVTDVEYESGGSGKHRDTNKLIIYTEGDLYVVDMGMRDGKYVSYVEAYALRDRLLSGDRRFDFIVWEHIPVGLMPRNTLYWVKQAVGIRLDDENVWDISYTREYHYDRRVDCVTGWGIFEGVWLVLEIFVYGDKVKLSYRRLVRIIKKSYKEYRESKERKR